MRRDRGFRIDWQHLADLESRNFTCWDCGSETGNNKGYVAGAHTPAVSLGNVYVFICPVCYAPNYFDERGVQCPGASFGKPVDGLPELVSRIYDEARRVMSVNGDHAAAMLCRKLIMHIAVEKGAKLDQGFEAYVTFLVGEGYIPKASHDYAKHIKNLGGEANHEIRDFTRLEAEEMIAFLEMLCRSCYEYPAKMQAKAPNQKVAAVSPQPE